VAKQAIAIGTGSFVNCCDRFICPILRGVLSGSSSILQEVFRPRILTIA
jgi:hypothetical protein